MTKKKEKGITIEVPLETVVSTIKDRVVAAMQSLSLRTDKMWEAALAPCREELYQCLVNGIAEVFEENKDKIVENMIAEVKDELPGMLVKHLKMEIGHTIVRVIKTANREPHR